MRPSKTLLHWLFGLVVAVACGSSGEPVSLVRGDTTRGSNAVVGAITGTVTDAQLRPIGGGVVEIRAGNDVVQTAVVGPSGSYTIPSLPAGTYGVRLQPPLTHSMAANEPLQRSVTIAANPAAATNVSFSVQPAYAADDFQAYTSTQQILAFCTNADRTGDFWSGTGKDGNCQIPTGTAIVLDPSGGPNGSKAVRYDWPARPTCPGIPTASSCNLTVALQPRLNPFRAVSNELWIRFTDKLSTGWKVGGGGAVSSGLEYKFLFIDVRMSGRSNLGQFQVELENGVGGPPVANYALRTKIVDYLNVPTTSQASATPPGPGDYPLGTGFDGKYHTWVFGITDIGSPAVTFTTYLDGVQVSRITGPWYPGEAFSQANAITIQMGANINNGPDQAQSRWWRELGVYASRPSLRPLAQ